MITDEEYKDIEPHRKDLIIFNETGQYKGGDALRISDMLRQRYGMAAPINYSCDGCKISAMNDLYAMMMEYENTHHNLVKT